MSTSCSSAGSIRSSIGVLFFTSSPAAVFWRIPLVIIESLKRVFSRAWSHVLVKGFKGLFPGFADCDAPSSIVTKGLASRITTAVDHVSPSSIFRRMSHSVREITQADIMEQAPTAFNSSPTKICRGYFMSLTAIAKGQPKGISMPRSNTARNYQASNSFICPVFHTFSLSKNWWTV